MLCQPISTLDWALRAQGLLEMGWHFIQHRRQSTTSQPLRYSVCVVVGDKWPNGADTCTIEETFDTYGSYNSQHCSHCMLARGPKFHLTIPDISLTVW